MNRQVITLVKILALNPGSTSTKIALYSDDECQFSETIRHGEEELSRFQGVMEQVEYRQDAVFAVLRERNVALESLSALVVRGGLLRPLQGGVWLVGEEMVDDLRECRYGIHASNLGAVMALPWGARLGIPVYTVDPVTVDEFEELARYSGLRGIERKSMSHALNMKAVAHKAAARENRRYEDMNTIIAHLGSGISVSAHKEGRMVDVNNANNEGPFSLERCGTLPALSLIELCFTSGKSAREMMELVASRGGIYSYLGTKDFHEVTRRVAAADPEAAQVVEAMAYQVSKEIGAMATVLQGRVDRILLTGGMAHAAGLVEMIRHRVSFIAPVDVYAGEEELEALAAGALRALRGETEARHYSKAQPDGKKGVWQ
jgi:butyrate kinase